MLLKKDFRNLLSFAMPDKTDIEIDQLVEGWLDNNPRLITTKDTKLHEFKGVGEIPSSHIVTPKGTELRLMQCDVPDWKFVVVDIKGESSPDELYYWVELEHTKLKEDEAN